MHLSDRGASYSVQPSAAPSHELSHEQILCYRGVPYQTPIIPMSWGSIPHTIATLRYRGTDYLVGHF